MRIARTPCLIALVVLCGLPAGVSVRAQVTSRELYVDDPRPVSEALLSLTKEYPTIVTYEDPRYAYSGDIQDITAHVRGNANDGRPRFLVPQGGELRVTYQVSGDKGQPVSYSDVLGSILEVARASPSGGRFEVRQEGEAFHVVPVQVRNVAGKWVQQTSILDTRITLSTDQQNYYRLTEAILAEVTKASGVTVGLAAEQFSPTFMHYKGRVSATNERARDVLMRTLGEMSKRFTYHLLYDPGEKYYAFGVHLAAEPPEEAGPTPTQPVVPRGASPAAPRARN